MIRIHFDDSSNKPEEVVLKNAHAAQRWGPKIRKIHGLDSRRATRLALATASGICSDFFSLVQGNFGSRAILHVQPLKADYQAAAIEQWGGVPADKLPWLASESAISNEYDAEIRNVDFTLTINIKSPPATLAAPLSMSDAGISPAGEAMLTVGVASVPLPLYLPGKMQPSDFAAAMDIISKNIHRAAVQLWIESSGGQREVF